MIVGWAVLSPLSYYKGWAPGPVGDMTTGARGWILWTALAIMVADSVVSLLPIIREFMSKSLEVLREKNKAAFGGNGAGRFGAIRLPRTPLTPAFIAPETDESRRRLHEYDPDRPTDMSDELRDTDGEGEEGSGETETPDRLVPAKWVLSGLAGSIVLGTVLVWAVFGHEGIKPWATVVGFLFGGVLSLLGCVTKSLPGC
jgi:membrane protease YdiL (CAAX protease family)